MDETRSSIEGLEVVLDTSLHVGALRYFNAESLGRARSAIPGGDFPRPRKALRIPAGAEGDAGEIVLAWRSPTETLILSADAAPLNSLATAIAGSSDASLVDQTGGIWAVRCAGPRAEDLLVRIGGAASVPKQGEALIGRFAELSVVALCPRPSEYVLLVERVYAEHLLGWISATIGDFK